MIIYIHKILIVAKALAPASGLNTRPANSPLLPLLGLLALGSKAVVYSKALLRTHIRRNPLLQKTRGYVTDNNNLNEIDLNNIDNTSHLSELQLTEGVPSLDDLLKFKEEIKKIREKEFDDLAESNTCSPKDFTFGKV